MISPGELQEWLGATDADVALLTQLEQRAVAFVEQMTGRYFGALIAQTDYLSGSGERLIWLDEKPETLPAPVVQWESSPNVWDTVDAAEYSIRNSPRPAGGAQLVHKTGWCRGQDNYRITYTRGYNAEQEPADIRQAVLDLVSLKFNGRGSENLKSESMGSYSYSFGDGDIASVPGLDSTIESWRWRRV